jgi:acetoin utilization deacetylase AcuC-like enzyme
MKLFFPKPVRNSGLFKCRYDLISEYKELYSENSQFSFSDKFPGADEIFTYFQLISKNSYSESYLGKLLTGDDPWKFIGALSDLATIYSGLDVILHNSIKRVYFMTNTGGHHADNTHYELFCPLNQLFFIVEYLNYHAGFPDIQWLDVDAHFGNGDKKIFDSYSNKMKSERNNLSGISLHNDYSNISEERYLGIQYEKDISNSNYLSVLQQNLVIDSNCKFLLVFFGTDIFSGDYGSNISLTTELIPEIITAIESHVPKSATVLYIQTGGASKSPIEQLITCLSDYYSDTNK